MEKVRIMQSNSFSERDLRCDFPARASFREALLERLLSMDEQELELERKRAREPRIIELSDDQLDLVAAAQGESGSVEAYLKTKGIRFD